MSWPRRSSVRVAPATEDRLEATHGSEVAHEDVERFAQIHVVEADSHRRSADAGLAVAIVGRALLRIAQDLVGLGDLLELGLCLGRRVPVGMVFHRQLPVGLLDLGLGSVPGQPRAGT